MISRDLVLRLACAGNALKRVAHRKLKKVDRQLIELAVTPDATDRLIARCRTPDGHRFVGYASADARSRSVRRCPSPDVRGNNREHRLRLTRCELPLFEPATIEALHEADGGLPRKVNLLAHPTLFAAAIAKAKTS